MRTRPMVLAFAVVCFAEGAHAQGAYSLTGRVAAGAGQTVQLPGFGVSCTDIRGNQAFAANPMQTYRQPFSEFSTNVVLNAGGCVPGSALLVSTTGSGGFMLPAMFFGQSHPGSLRVVPEPARIAVAQLATSFALSGPAFTSTPFEPQNPRKAGTPKFTPAAWNSFRANAHLTASGYSYGSFAKVVGGSAPGVATPSMGATSVQTRVYLNMYVSGRTSSDFTACAQVPGMAASVACTFPTQGTIPGVVKNIAGPRVFGGTLGLVLSSGGANPSSIAFTLAGGYTSPGGMNTMATRGNLALYSVAGSGSALPGRGYAAYRSHMMPPGTLFQTHKLTTYNMSLPYFSRLVGKVGGATVMLPGATNRNHAFPWTTGTVIVRGTGKTAADGTFSLMGYDTRTTTMGATGMGGEGNIQLVAGGLSQVLPHQAFGGTSNYSVMRLEFAPEPAFPAGFVAGAIGLVALAARRVRPVHRLH